MIKIVVSSLKLNKLSDSIKFGLVAGAFTAVIMVAPSLYAQSSSSGRDCDANAVIRCGALTTGELKQKYKSQQDVKVIFSHFGISASEVNSMGSTAKQGYVTRDGKVVVNGKTVATDATTAGRQNMSGSKAVTKNGVTFYVRPPSVSFSQSQLSALVVMKDGQFQFAVLKSCGNPVKAKPVEKPKPKPEQPKPVTRQKPQPPQPPQPAPPAPAPVVEQKQVNNQVNNQTVVVAQGQEQRTVAKEEAPAPAPQPAPAPAPTPQPSAKEEAPAPQETLPDTGMGDVLGMSALVTVGSSLWYAVYNRLRLKFL